MDGNEPYTFSAKIDIIGINPFVFVPGAILDGLFMKANKRKGHIPIRGTINGNAYKQTLVKYSGAWRLYVNTTMLRACLNFYFLRTKHLRTWRHKK